MAIMSVARFQFHPARVSEGIENAKKAKEMFLANGAESEISISSGPRFGGN
jgi:hypothetical protein